MTLRFPPYIELYLIRGPCLIGELAGKATCDFQKKSGGKYYTFDVSNMEELIGSGLLLSVIHQVCVTQTRYPRIPSHAIVTDKYIPPAGFPYGPSCNCVNASGVIEKVLHIIGSMCMWFKQSSTCYLLKV